MSVDHPLPTTHPPAPGAVSTCTALSRVLQRRQLHAADELFSVFSVGDYDIISELHPALTRIKQLINEPNYASNEVDQQVVELVLSRITAAIRETAAVETALVDLVDLIETCLTHRMSIGLNAADSPHCKILLEVLSTLFLFHSKRSVMTVAIPALIKTLGNSNQELVRNTTTYLSLAAIHNARVLAIHSVQLLGFALKGNRPLLRVLPQIYPENREPFHAHLSPLLGLLYDPTTETSEKLSLLQLLNMIANVKPDMIIPQLSNLDDFLFDCATCSTTLKLFTSLINQGRISCIMGQLMSLRRAALQPTCSQQNLGVLVQIFSQIAKTNEQMSTVACNDCVRVCQRLSGQQLAQALREVESIAEVFPHVVFPHIEVIRELDLSCATYTKIRTITAEVPVKRDELSIGHSVPLPNVVDSLESLGALSKRSSRAFPSDPAPFAIPEEVAADELDRNMQHLADSYRLRSNGSLGLSQPRSRSFMSLSNSSGARPHDPTTYPTAGNRPGNETHLTTPARNSNVVPDPPRSDLVLQPNTPLPSVPFVANIQLGRDGRVRPMPTRPTQRQANWKGVENSAANVATTTFPVFDRLPTRGHTLSGSQVRMVDEHVAKSRSQSVRSSRTNSAAADPTRGTRGDLVRQFVDHRQSKIRQYIHELNSRYPIPVKCTIEGTGGKRNGNKMRIHFACEMRGSSCVFGDVDRLFAFKTKVPATWLHLMFLHVEVTHLQLTGQILAQDSAEYRKLASCWECLPKEVTKSQPFATLVTSAFPDAREQKSMLSELHTYRLFDSFFFDAAQQKWGCVTCAFPDRVHTLMKSGAQSGLPLLEGRLKERRGALTCTTGNRAARSPHRPTSAQPPAIELSKIRSVRSVSQGRKHRKSLPRAFEIFTEDDEMLVLKATDRTRAADWVQCIQIACAQAHQRHS